MNKGNPEIFLQVLNFTFVEFSSNVYDFFLNKDYELFSKNDMRFMETIYQILVFFSSLMNSFSKNLSLSLKNLIINLF